MRAVMVLFTPLNFYQHDVSNFSGRQAGFHDSYILYIYENFTIPDGDVRELGQFYHPPLHYILSALFLRLHNVLPLKFANDINGLKFLPMLWTSFIVLFTKKILERLNINGKALVFSMLLISLNPHLIYLAIQVNNDALALMLMFAAVCFALEWYKDPELKKIVYIALSIGCAMMTKLSMGLVAFPVAWIFLIRLIRTAKAQKENKGKKTALTGLIKQFAVFAVIVFPLGLWFPLRNLISYGVPVTYVYEIDSSANMDVWMYSPLQRLLIPSADLLKTPFILEGGNINDFNIVLALIKTGLFDERNFDSSYLTAIAKILEIIAFVLLIAVLFAAVRGAIKRYKDSDNAEGIALWILAAVLLISEFVFCFKYPVTCTAAFRYITPVLIPVAFWSGSIIKTGNEKEAGASLKICSVCLEILIVLFVLLTVLFYGPFAQYSVVWQALIKG